MNSSTSTIRLLEELSLNAWPALQTLWLDGWLLRFAEGYTRRANSVQPLYSTIEEGNLIKRIEHCESLYASARRQNVVFKMTGAAMPNRLDAVLAQRGYSHEAETSVQTLDLHTFSPARLGQGQVTIQSQVSEEWLAAYMETGNVAVPHRPVLRQMLSNIVVPTTAFAILRRNSKITAVGMAVAERGHVGLFDIITAPQWRGQGLGTHLVTSLLAWGRDKGATSAYLQVMRNNSAALRLYAKLGFVDAYGYWYRVKPAADILG